MAHYQPIVLKYLEHYHPDFYAGLKERHELRTYMDTIVNRIYEQAESMERRLADEHPGENPERLAIHAEQMAIATVLPTEPIPELTAEYSDDEDLWRFIEEQN